MLSEVNNDLFTLCEDAVNEICMPFIERMHVAYDETPEEEWDSKSNEIIEDEIANLSLCEKFTIACYKIELEDDTPESENKVPNHDYLVEWFRFQWDCALEDEYEL